MTLAEIAQAGDRLAVLQLLRDRLAADLDEAVEPRDVAVLALRLCDVLQQIDLMPSSGQVSAADEIAERRASRRGAGGKGAARSKGAG